MSESNPIVKDIRQYAIYETAAGSTANTMNVKAPERPEQVLNLNDLSAREIEAYVNSGELTAEQVYAHESAAEHPRKTVLKKYAPVEEDSGVEEDSE